MTTWNGTDRTIWGIHDDCAQIAAEDDARGRKPMSEQSFAESVRESRLFLRRRLVERLAVTQLRMAGGINAAQVVQYAADLTIALTPLEEADLARMDCAGVSS